MQNFNFLKYKFEEGTNTEPLITVFFFLLSTKCVELEHHRISIIIKNIIEK